MRNGKKIQEAILWMLVSLAFSIVWNSNGDVNAQSGELTKEGDYQLSGSCPETPVLTEFETRLKAIRYQIGALIDDCKKGKITRLAAETKIRALLEEELSIQRDPQYDIERNIRELFCGLR